MLVRDVIGQKPADVVTVRPTDELTHAIRLLIAHNVGGLAVVGANGAVEGFLAERDIVRAVHHRLDALTSLKVQDVARPAAICDVNDTLQQAMRTMTNKRERHLVVCDGSRLVGVLSVGDMVKHRVDEFQTEAGVLRDYVAAHRAASSH